MTVQKDDGAYRLDDIGLAFDHLGRERYSICDDDPLSARLEVTWRVEFSRGEWRIRTKNWCLMTASKDAFHITAIVSRGVV